MMPAAAERPPVVLRGGEESDLGFVFSTWADTFLDTPQFLGLFPAQSVERAAFRAAIFNRAKGLAGAGHVVVAAFDEAPAYILGWVAFVQHGGPVHYVYVRPANRGQGIARMLLGAAGYALGKPVKATHWTHACEGKRVVYVPECMYSRRRA